MLQYEIYSPLSSNKTAQRNLQHWTKLYHEMNNEMHNLLHTITFIEK